MATAEIITVVAIVTAPFIAVFAQRQIDLWRETRQRRLWVFKTLMATRGMALSRDHVQALNMIALEFAGQKDEAVRRSWREYFDHLCSFPSEGEQREQRLIVWSEKTQELLAALLDRMGKTLGYDFDPVELRKGAYAPQAHAITDLELQVIRKELLELLSGRRPLRVTQVEDGCPK